MFVLDCFSKKGTFLGYPDAIIPPKSETPRKTAMEQNAEPKKENAAAEAAKADPDRELIKMSDELVIETKAYWKNAIETSVRKDPTAFSIFSSDVLITMGCMCLALYDIAYVKENQSTDSLAIFIDQFRTVLDDSINAKESRKEYSKEKEKYDSKYLEEVLYSFKNAYDSGHFDTFPYFDKNKNKVFVLKYDSNKKLYVKDHEVADPAEA